MELLCQWHIAHKLSETANLHARGNFEISIAFFLILQLFYQIMAKKFQIAKLSLIRVTELKQLAFSHQDIGLFSLW